MKSRQLRFHTAIAVFHTKNRDGFREHLFHLTPADVGLVTVGLTVKVKTQLNQFPILWNIPAVGRGASHQINRIVHAATETSGYKYKKNRFPDSARNEIRDLFFS